VETSTCQYPNDLARFVRDHWNDAAERHTEISLAAELEHIVSICYQASLLREESREVTFRVIVAEPEQFAPADGPPNGLHRLSFSQRLPFTAHELRRLSPAARFHRSLIGVSFDLKRAAQIWGIIHTGPRWLTSLHGGRGTGSELPPYLVIGVPGTGHVEVSRGSTTIGQLSDGRVFGPSMNVFESQWLQSFFAPIRKERWSLHLQARQKSQVPWARLNPELARIIDQNMMKRLIAAIRAFHHGGILVFVPSEYADQMLDSSSPICLKYKFQEGEPRARFRTLIVSMMNTLAELGGKKGKVKDVSWEEYERTHDRKVTELDEAIFEISHLIAALSTVDGAVVMTKRFELLGFGGDIRCDLSGMATVAKARDIEGQDVTVESVLGVGTRHRSAYALCNSLREALAIVISQDGSVRFVRWKDDGVTYWDHQATFTFSARL